MSTKTVGVFLQCRSRSFFNLKPICHSLTVSNSQVYSNDEFDLWPVYSGERFRALRPSCLSLERERNQNQRNKGVSNSQLSRYVCRLRHLTATFACGLIHALSG